MALPLVLIAIAALAAVFVVVRSLTRAVDARLSATDSEVRRLADAASRGDSDAREVRREVALVRDVLGRFQASEEDRRHREEQAWAALHRVAAVLAGSQKAGRTGERVLAEVLGSLPPSMLERDYRVNGRMVEFALILPDGKRLPIDSKWPAEDELALLESGVDPESRDRAIAAVERIVARRAREVSGYRDPALTSPLAVAAIPDAAYAVLRRAHCDAYRQGVIVVPYSMALPIVLALHTLSSRIGAAGDVQACLADLAGVLDSVESTLENKLERAATMLGNGTGELRSQLGQARGALARARQPAPVVSIREAVDWGHEDGPAFVQSRG